MNEIITESSPKPLLLSHQILTFKLYRSYYTVKYSILSHLYYKDAQGTIFGIDSWTH